MPKYCIRADGAVYPYCPGLAASARFKVVDELPTAHLHGIEQARRRTDQRVEATAEMRQRQDLRHAQRHRETRHLRKQLASGPEVDTAAAEEAQRQADAFSGREPG